METVTLVLLRWAPRATEFSQTELDQLWRRHLEYLDEMRRAGRLVAAGPVDGQPDPSLGELCVYAVEPDVGRSLAEDDPLVRAGPLVVEAFRWSLRTGEVAFPRGGVSALAEDLYAEPTPGPGNSDGGDVPLP